MRMLVRKRCEQWATKTELMEPPKVHFTAPFPFNYTQACRLLNFANTDRIEKLVAPLVILSQDPLKRKIAPFLLISKNNIVTSPRLF